MTDHGRDGSAVRDDDAGFRHSAAIRALNDRARATLSFHFAYVTVGVRALGEATAATAIKAVRDFDDFTADNDLYREHDFGAFTLKGARLFWKIDYYNRQLTGGSPDPADGSVTARVLTIMLASEY